MRLRFLLFFIFAGQALWAQLSPGDLHQSHAGLEGLRNCTKCHSEGDQVKPGLCLDCHKAVKISLEQKKGLHRSSEFETCVNCHVDHLGRNADLRHWPDGQKNFDHKKTGFELKGKHQNADCKSCHQPKFMVNADRLRQQEINPEKTFFGLTTDCVSCHADVHHKTLGENCASCHNETGWLTAAGFDHAKTAFPLSGKHLNVKCSQCHQTSYTNRDIKSAALIFKRPDAGQCQTCHTDPHQNRFGENCTGCHQTSGWQNLVNGKFNHDKTRYPLAGRHRLVNCESCHKPGLPKRSLAFSKCTDCHRDEHLGQFKNSQPGPACENCHSTDGFSPAHFSTGQHNKSRFKLENAHLAVPCFLCHKTEKMQGQSTARFRFDQLVCESCHNNPHGKTLPPSDADRCAACHQTVSWKKVTFSHEQTRFKLTDRHEQAECRACHLKNSQIVFDKNTLDCATCHADTHRGQLRPEGTTQTDCAVCHTAKDWLAEKFDHETRTRFSLQGGHQFVPCAKCHLPEQDAQGIFIRYKPLSAECKTCHQTQEITK